MKKLIYVVLACLMVTSSAEAQFFKKLQKKVEKKVEDVVTRNVSDKAASETEKSLNKMWDMDFENGSMPIGMAMVDLDEVPSSYDFTWKYTMSIQTDGKDMELQYFMKENAPYLGMKVLQAENMFMVMDFKQDLMVMFLSGKNNMLTAMDLPTVPEDYDYEAEEEQYEMKKIGNKTILGYNCEGYQTETDDGIFSFYVTDKAGVNFNDLFTTKQKNIPRGVDPKWMKNGGLMMEMTMENKKDPEKSMRMVCTEIEKSPFRIKKANYNSIAQ